MALLLLALFLTPRVQPASLYWAVGLLTFLIVPGWMVNVGALLLALRRRRWWLAAALVAVAVVGWPYVRATFCWQPPAAPAPAGAVFKVLTYNVKMFDHRPATAGQDDLQTARKQVAWIIAQNADLICLQEFYSFQGNDAFNTLAQLRRAGYYHLAFHPHTIKWSGQVPHHYGVILLSRYPIVRSGELRIDRYGANQIIYADVATPADTLRLYGAHLQSYNLSHPSESWRYVYERLREGFSKRGEQVNQLVSHLARSPYPVILCGDLNDTPYSYTYYRLRHHLRNAFETRGRGFGFTFPSRGPLFRIDNIFADDAFRCLDYQVLDRALYSDHRPVTARYQVAAGNTAQRRLTNSTPPTTAAMPSSCPPARVSPSYSPQPSATSGIR